ncbi:putative component of NuA3 histone acetyltransferase complex [Stygiomarasmius scandens]|uniref:Component of NuA3 histone acetyltransferase complex n=1 Tax=Marasmiellus scandens TaxID=2682957 RepID=A0ABR1K5S1_9AGAR
MTKTHERPESPAPDAGPSKKMKTIHSSLADGTDVTSAFASGVLDHANIANLHKTYLENKPFHYALVEKLFQDDLLSRVKEECITELSFTEKQTDIYKVNQTGDLASLNYLSASQISLLPNLLKLRDALYSSTFRSFLRSVTGCGPLSGTKQDMSVNSYTKGCHLLNHDDVIGTRRVSYILYMPLPHYQFWQKDWGGALELYPTKLGPNGTPEPQCVPAKSIPPSWNQFIFFEVQPGQSFHSVEEVVVDEEGRERLSISGWFHAAQPGEEGYEPLEESQFKSSREQLTESKTNFQVYPESSAPPLPDGELSAEQISFLSEYINPVYLQPRTMSALAGRFLEESSLELHSFLSNDLAQALEPRLRELDSKDGLGPDRHGKIPPHYAGINPPESQEPPPSMMENSINTMVNIIPQNLAPLQNGLNGLNGIALGNHANGDTNSKPAEALTPSAWTVKGPPHKWRYCTLLPPSPSAPATSVTPLSAHPSPSEILRTLQDELFPSEAFRAWLAVVSKLLPMRYVVEARRFRPGLDYTLATSEEKEARLDVVLGLTPEPVNEDIEMENGRGSRRQNQQKEVKGWGTAEWGGWECYMAPHNEEDDPAVYRGGTYKKSDVLNNINGAAKKPSSSNGHVNESNGSNGATNGGTKSPLGNGTKKEVENGADKGIKEEAEEDETMEAEDDEEDSTLLTVQPGFNRLLLVLRDEKVMRFVKYVSAAAEGSRWDVCAEYEVGMVAEEEEEEEEAQNED